MTGVAIGINASGGSPAYSAAQWRQAAALALMYGGRNMGGRQGVRPGGNQLQVSLAGSAITVQPGICAIDPGLTTPQGPYWVAIPVAEGHTLTAADASNPRKDIVIARVYDHDEDASGLRLARTEYLAGTAAPSPAEPAVPAGAFRLATIDVPQSGGGSAVVTDRRPWTVAPGGILPVRDSSAVTGAAEGMYRDRLDTNLLERYRGSAWEAIADPAQFRPWTDYSASFQWTATTTNPTLGNGSVLAHYMQVGKLVFYSGRLTIGSTTTFGTGSWRFSMPVPGQDFGAGDVILYDSDTNANRQPGVIWNSAGGVLRLTGKTGDIGGTEPFVWAAGDQIRWTHIYEAL